MGKRQTFSSEMKTRLVEEYFKSSLSQRQFSEQNGVNIHSLSSWITEYNKSRKEQKQKETEQVSLIPLEAAVKALAVSNEEPAVQSDIIQSDDQIRTYVHMRMYGVSFEIDADDIPLLLGAMSHD